MDREAWQRRSRSFGGVADAYERYRPGYPPDAVAWLFGAEPRRVLDLAAGTGKLTAALVGAGHRVVAVEPDPQMRAVFAQARPGVEILAGTAESIPLPDDSVDAAAVGQAWHWFDPPRALGELARVLRPGGTLGILWNSRDGSVPLVAELGRVIEGADAASGLHGEESAGDLGPLFTPVERATFRHVQVTDVDGLVGLVASRSHTITLGEPERVALLARVEEIARRESLRSPDGTILLPYLTVCHRAHRID
jgi:SAM-dependent methyltransferase